MFKRMTLFLLTNLAVIVLISLLLSIFNVQPYLNEQGLNYQSLLIYAAIIGFSGAVISLFMSKWLAKRAYNIRIIHNPRDQIEAWLLSTVRQLANRNHLGMPEIGIYESPEPNAFATGWNKNNALVAVSTGLLRLMDPEELEAVLGHEIAHIANGDMVTLTLIQGVVNTFVIFFARIAAFLVMQVLRIRGNISFIYYGIAILFQLLFGILASLIVMWFSRQREYRADADSAKHVGAAKMIKALHKLQTTMKLADNEQVEPALEVFKISSNKQILGLFSSHPPLTARIKALQNIKRVN